MKKNTNTSGNYTYYNAKKNNNEKIKEIELTLNIIEGTIKILEFLTYNDHIERVIDQHFKTKSKNRKINNYYDSLKLHFEEVKSTSKISIIDIREECKNSDYKNYLWEKLRRSGLTGFPIETKYNFWVSLFNDLIDFLKNLPKNIKGSIENFGTFLNEKKEYLLCKFLKFTNVILLSICSAIPFVEVIKEYKDLNEQFYLDCDPKIIIA